MIFSIFVSISRNSRKGHFVRFSNHSVAGLVARRAQGLDGGPDVRHAQRSAVLEILC